MEKSELTPKQLSSVPCPIRSVAARLAYQFVTRCANCAKEFGILWVMDPTRRVGIKTVARITCPLCRTRFHQDAKDLLPIESPRLNLVVGRPVRSVEVDYDCPFCSKRGRPLQELFSGVLASSGHTRSVSAEDVDHWRSCVHPDAQICVAFIVAVLPTNHLFGHCGP
jgi:DNA-directed RNA polymerase subunit RPC12/RpoP